MPRLVDGSVSNRSCDPGLPFRANEAPSARSPVAKRRFLGRTALTSRSGLGRTSADEDMSDDDVARLAESVIVNAGP